MEYTMMRRRHFLATVTTGAIGLTLTRWLPAAVAEAGSAIELGVATSFARHAALKSAGFQYIEESVGRLLMPEAGDAEFERTRLAVASASLPVYACANFVPGDMKIVGPKVEMEALLRYVEIAFRRAGKAGVKRIVLGSGKSRQIPEGCSRDRAVEQLVDFGRRIAPLAQSHGVIVVLEPLQYSECNFINRVDEGLAIVEGVNHSNFQQHADIFHMLRVDEGPESLVKAGARLKHCHIATKKGRKAPGLEEQDCRPYFKALKQIGYRGGMSIAARWGKDLTAELPIAFSALRKQIESA
jgi:sugar phosphate isomerase/epimerase